MTQRMIISLAAALAMTLSVTAQASSSLSSSQLQDVVYLAEIASVRHLAQSGNPQAQFILGNRYFKGDSAYRLPQSYDDAMGWYLKSARQGHTGAAYNLGVMSLKAKGMPRDLIEALAWFKIAAHGGHGNSKKLIAELESLLGDEHIQAAEALTVELVPQRILAAR
ncbi:MAG: sel1 repeat family protein [Xanthomonadales bacterium]|jgi:TPR repeat protein|nr:sel1 repeat family protein [Xanthomonadales bacterium]